MHEFIEYSPIIIVVLMFFVQQKIFVTPEQLEKKHREILDEMEEKFTCGLCASGGMCRYLRELDLFQRTEC